jgi:hyperosmotically inducible protein
MRNLEHTSSPTVPCNGRSSRPPNDESIASFIGEIAGPALRYKRQMSRRMMLLLGVLLLGMPGVITSCARGPRPPAGTIDLSLEDARLLAAVRTTILNDSELGLRPISIDVRARVVTLSGTVRTPDEVKRAQQLVREVEGVRDVRSELRIEP